MTYNAADDRAWVTSSYSNDQGGECVEVRLTPRVGVRDSKNSGGPAIFMNGEAWHSFLSLVTRRQA
ncbi:DUF397 domain-containing protein [Streptomyces sp. NPDC058695]|uniref:DUF397 domain-containing protein n=1 Tax=Streptomyces sp. NPDC058695 TaxID=3346604 RepID=UPI00365AA726